MKANTVLSMPACLLFVVVLFLPLAPVFASEDVVTVTSEAIVEAPVAQVVEEHVPDVAIEEDVLVEEISTEETIIEESLDQSTQNSDSQTTVVSADGNEQLQDESETDGITDVVNEIVPSEDTASSTDLISSTSTDTATEDETSIIEPVEAEVEADTNLSSTTEEGIDVEILPLPLETQSEVEETEVPAVAQADASTTSLEATTTEGVVSEEVVGSFIVVDPANVVVTDQNRFTFSKNECISVGDGSFYCSDATSTVPGVIGVDRVYAASDADGDREIYVEKDGSYTAVTQNLVDDDAPYYDDLSNTIVWHRLVDTRYQIVSYDLDSDTETVVTSDHYNNMEPSRTGDVMVWQGWIGNDWEIMLEENGEISMLTDNDFHDVAPRVNGNYVMWQSFESSAWRVKVYDLHTKQIDTIADAESASVENPRFVLVYDSKHENGDVETKGYDLRSKEIIQLGSKSTPVPDKLPDPEQTGEERALVQPPIQIKTRTDAQSDDGNDVLTNTSTSTDIEELVVPAFSTTDSMSTSTELVQESREGTLGQAPQDLVVSTLVENAPTTTPHIDDLIITPYTEPIIDVDSQTEVASST